MACEKIVFMSLLVILLSSYSSQSVINSEIKTELDSKPGNTDLKSDVDTNPDPLNGDVIMEHANKENKDFSSKTDDPIYNPTIPEANDEISEKSKSNKTHIPDGKKINDETESLSDFDPSIANLEPILLDENADQIEEIPKSPHSDVQKEETVIFSDSEEDRTDIIDTTSGFTTTVKPGEQASDSESMDNEDKSETEGAPEGAQGTVQQEGMVDTSVRELDPVELTPEDEDMVIMKMRELGGILDEKEIADIIEQEQTVEEVEGDLPEDIEDLKFEPIPMPTDFESYDRNGDGLIEMEELTDVTGAFENVADAFIVCDKNGDGFIDEEEFKDAPWDLSGKPPEVVEEQL